MIQAGQTQVYFGATPHNVPEFTSIVQWIGEDGLMLDTRSELERTVSETTSFQYHTRMEITEGNYIHFPITDRSVPTHKRGPPFRQVLRRALTHPRVYVHCRGGHGRSAVVVACMLRECGETAISALALVRASHAERTTMTTRMRTLGAPQNVKQQQFVQAFATGMEDDEQKTPVMHVRCVHFYETRGEYGFLSNLWGTPRTYRWRELGGPTHLVIDGVVWPTVEHYFQAQKFNLQTLSAGESLQDFETTKTLCGELIQYIRHAATGASVFRLGRIGHPNQRKSIKSGYAADHHCTRNRAWPKITESRRPSTLLSNDSMGAYGFGTTGTHTGTLS
jgi:protein-tyrosine phosphatase